MEIDPMDNDLDYPPREHLTPRDEINNIGWWLLDFSNVRENRQVQAQGILLCMKTKSKGFFSIALERFPTRQDLATKIKINYGK